MISHVPMLASAVSAFVVVWRPAFLAKGAARLGKEIRRTLFGRPSRARTLPLSSALFASGAGAALLFWKARQKARRAGENWGDLVRIESPYDKKPEDLPADLI